MTLKSNAGELALIAQEIGAEVTRGPAGRVRRSASLVVHSPPERRGLFAFYGTRLALFPLLCYNPLTSIPLFVDLLTHVASS